MSMGDRPVALEPSQASSGKPQGMHACRAVLAMRPPVPPIKRTVQASRVRGARWELVQLFSVARKFRSQLGRAGLRCSDVGTGTPTLVHLDTQLVRLVGAG
eukprot:CAMPEP_0176312372 /NCGR_PEP_ID=MMETSP0121_2-20121125/66631_1 /TAXON_ID=160619 /ORGANISM="Kryptoperidinium foliaceum, Strain CCMP 1326" /LENGTH=100 /DNA_ID=CAMNT_0017654445 /DNA_START=24 /DNA_END=324 /DNA_ORIENTATION=-